MNNKYAIGMAAFLAVALAFSVKNGIDKEKERARMENNQTTLMQKVETYRTKDSLSAASVQSLTLTNRELSVNRSDLSRTIESLNLKMKRVESISTAGTETNYAIKQIVKDSIVYKEGKTDTLRCINYRDKWLTVSGCASREEFSGTIQSRDTITQIAHRVPKKFWFIKYGTKAIRQEVVSKNPNSKITFAEFIKIIK